MKFHQRPQNKYIIIIIIIKNAAHGLAYHLEIIKSKEKQRKGKEKKLWSLHNNHS
jgi:hypothetical protein